MNIFPWLLTTAILGCSYPWVQLALKGERSPVLLAMTTLGVSLGLLTLSLLALGMVGIALDWRIAAAFCAVVGAAGFIRLARVAKMRPQPHAASSLGRDPGYQPQHIGRWVITGMILIIGALIIFNAIYWPFGIDDSVAIYAWYGKLIAQTRALPPLAPGDLYEAYPMLLPLSYAFTHQAAGWINEYLAALIPALLSVGTLGVAYLLGRALYGIRVGLAAALLCALTPAFTFWAGASYADLPCAFFYGLSALYLLRATQHDRTQDWFLAGILAGLAAWTKNSGLLITGSLILWLVYHSHVRQAPPRQITRWGALLGGAFVLVVLPWYVRNLVLAGVLVPATGWTYAAQRTIANLFPYLTSIRYLPTGLVLTAGLGATVLTLFRKQGVAEAKPYAFFLLSFFGPFFTVWWLLFSYDPRFLFVVFPFIAVMGGKFTGDVLAWVQAVCEPRCGAFSSKALHFSSLVALILIAIPAASAAVDHKVEMLRRPLMSDYEKHVVRLGDRYALALYLRETLSGAHVWTQDQLLPYHADSVRLYVGPIPKQADLTGFDYWVASPGDTTPPWMNQAPVFISGNYRLYRVSLP